MMLMVSPGSSSALEVPPLAGRVNDNAELLSQSTRERLEETLRQLEEKTNAQIAILTIKSLEGEDRDGYSIKVAQSWGLGEDDKDNGLLILYAAQEDRLKIEVGYGLEGAIPDGKAGEILRTNFRGKAPKEGSKDLDNAFLDVVEAISSIVLAEYAKDPTGGSMKGDSGDGEFMLMLLFGAFVVAGIVGALNEPLGVIVGGLEGACFGLYLLFGPMGIVVLVLVGAIVGYLAKFVLEGVLSLDSGGSGSYSSGGSYGAGSGFSGGGGDFGGGGAGD